MQKMIIANKLIHQSCRESTQKPVVFLYTNNEQFEDKIGRTIPFTVASERIKYIGINLAKEVSDFDIVKTIKYY